MATAEKCPDGSGNFGEGIENIAESDEVLLEKYKKAKRDALVLVKIIGCIVVG